jgi:hypothetical protein
LYRHCTRVHFTSLCTGRTAHRGGGVEVQLYSFMTTALERGESSASRPGHSLPPGKTRYPLYRWLGRLQGRFGQVRKISPLAGLDLRTVQPAASRNTNWATRPTLVKVHTTKMRISCVARMCVWNGVSVSLSSHRSKRDTILNPERKQTALEYRTLWRVRVLNKKHFMTGNWRRNFTVWDLLGGQNWKVRSVEKLIQLPTVLFWRPVQTSQFITPQ